MRIKQLAGLSLAFLFLFMACEQEHSETPIIEMPITFGFKSQLKAAAEKELTGFATPQVTFTNGLMRFQSFAIEAESLNDQDSLELEMEIEKMMTVDLSDLQTPDTIARVPAGEYEEIEIEMELLDNDALASVHIEGNFTNSNDKVTPVVFHYKDDLEFSIEGEADDGEAISISAAEAPLAKITLSADSLFAHVTEAELESAQRNANDVIWISEEVNAEVYEKITEQLDNASEVEFRTDD